MNVILNIIDNLESELKRFPPGQRELHKIEELIGRCRLAYIKVKKRISTREFKNTSEEIHFFKVLKPRIYAPLLYYNSLYRIEINRPQGNKKILQRYFEDELTRINNFNKEYKGFYQYYKSDASYLDEKFFTRNSSLAYSQFNLYIHLVDIDFSTMHDFTLSMIQANESLSRDIIRELEYIKTKPSSKGNKVYLIELIYALQVSGMVNNSNIQLNKLKEEFEQLFNIELKDFYRTFIEVRQRKINRTKFLDILKTKLESKLEDLDS